jgi:Serine dehydrogenase proteinase
LNPLSLLWLFILASLQPAAERYMLEARRRSNLASLSRKRGATVITLIHRQETMSFFGFPVVRRAHGQGRTREEAPGERHRRKAEATHSP